MDDQPKVGMPHPVLNVLLLPSKHIVQYRHFMAQSHELVHQMRTDKTGSTSDENLFTLMIRETGRWNDLRCTGSGKRMGGQCFAICEESERGRREVRTWGCATTVIVVAVRRGGAHRRGLGPDRKERALEVLAEGWTLIG